MAHRRSRLHRAAGLSIGEGRMNNLQITVTVIAIAVAQALTILLTLGRERDIMELRELVNELRAVVDEQRLRIVELRAWLAGRNAAQPSLSKAPEPAITPKDLPETIPPRTTEDEAAQAMKVLNWQREIGRASCRERVCNDV